MRQKETKVIKNTMDRYKLWDKALKPNKSSTNRQFAAKKKIVNHWNKKFNNYKIGFKDTKNNKTQTKTFKVICRIWKDKKKIWWWPTEIKEINKIMSGNEKLENWIKSINSLRENIWKTYFRKKNKVQSGVCRGIVFKKR